MSTLTDAYGGRHYASCLTFHESRSLGGGETSSSGAALLLEEGDDDDFIAADESTRPGAVSTVLFRPKCLVLVSRRPYFDLFRCCLNQLYYAFLDQQSRSDDERFTYRLETMIAGLISGIYLPPIGSPSISFTLAPGGERLSIRPPLSDTVPLTGGRVAVLFQQLGWVHFVMMTCLIVCRHDSQSIMCAVRRACRPQNRFSFDFILPAGRRMLCTHCTALSVQISVSDGVISTGIFVYGLFYQTYLCAIVARECARVFGKSDAVHHGRAWIVKIKDGTYC